MNKPMLLNENARAAEREWTRFEQAVRSAADQATLSQLALRGPQSGEPGGVFFTNLAYLLRYGHAPDGAKARERELYARISFRIEPRGSL